MAWPKRKKNVKILLETQDRSPWSCGLQCAMYREEMRLWGCGEPVHVVTPSTVTVCRAGFMCVSICCWFSDAEFTALWLLSEWSLSNTHFPLKTHHSLLVLGSMGQHFSAMLGGHFKQWNRQKKHKNAKNVALNRLRKGPLFIVWVESRSRAWPSLTSAGNSCGGWLLIFHHPVHVREWPRRCHQTDLGVTKRF